MSFDYNTIVTIPNAGTTPVAGVPLRGATIVGVNIPAGLEGTTLKFTVGLTLAQATYLPLYGTDGNEVSYTVGASRFVPLDPAVFAGIDFFKPVVAAQTGAIDLTFAVRRV